MRHYPKENFSLDEEKNALSRYITLKYKNMGFHWIWKNLSVLEFVFAGNWNIDELSKGVVFKFNDFGRSCGEEVKSVGDLTWILKSSFFHNCYSFYEIRRFSTDICSISSTFGGSSHLSVPKYLNSKQPSLVFFSVKGSTKPIISNDSTKTNFIAPIPFSPNIETVMPSKLLYTR